MTRRISYTHGIAILMEVLVPHTIIPATGTRWAVNITLPETLLRDTRELGINLSRACQRGPVAEVAASRRQCWSENRESLGAWTEHVARNSLPRAAFRQFRQRPDVHPVPGKGDGQVIDVQAGLLPHLDVRVVATLLPNGATPQPVSGLTHS